MSKFGELFTVQCKTNQFGQAFLVTLILGNRSRGVVSGGGGLEDMMCLVNGC